MIVVKSKVGKSQLDFEAQDLKTVCKWMSLIGDFPDKCGLCGGEDIHLYYKSPKGNDYYGLKCKDCGAEFNFHQRKEGGFYIRYDDQWSKYESDNSNASQSNTRPPDPEPTDAGYF